MQTHRTELNFEGQNIFAGIDVHLRSWTVSIVSERLTHNTFTQPTSAEVLHNHLVHNFSGGTYHSVYETGFSGLRAHYKLTEMGIKNIVTNAADVPTKQKGPILKDDPTDGRKIARSLWFGDLEPIYVPHIETFEDWPPVRLRASMKRHDQIQDETKIVPVFQRDLFS